MDIEYYILIKWLLCCLLMSYLYKQSLVYLSGLTGCANQNKEEDESEDEDLSLESEVEVRMVIDTETLNGGVRVLVRNLDLLTARMEDQEAVIVSLRNQLGGLRTEVVEQLDTCIERENWVHYHRDTYAFVKNKKSRLLMGCAELLGTCQKLEDRVEELEMVKDDHSVMVVEKKDDVVEELLKEALGKQEDEIFLLKNRLGSDCVKFGSVNLRSLEDTFIFVNTEMMEVNTSFGCFFILSHSWTP